MERVEDLVVNEILKKLGAEDIGRVACVSKRFYSFSSEEPLWIHLCFRDLSLTQPLDHLGNPLPSFKETYKTWREAFAMYPWPLVYRVKTCWDTIKTWLINNFPEAEATLCKGASEAEIQELERALNVKLPLTTRILYRFHNGQEIAKEDIEDSTFYSSLGLIGGYSFYSHFVNVYLLPISQVIQQTRRITRHLGFFRRSKYVLVAASSTYTEKLFFLNCTNGQLYVGTKNFPDNGEMIPCVPHDLISLDHEVNNEQQQDAMLLWLEEHGRRLQHGFTKLIEEGNIRSINLFPEQPPLCSMAVTNGVQVRASALLIPELADLQDDVEKYLFAYSIRMSLEPQGCVINGMPFSSCQLHWRHWVIRANDIVVSDVNGEAVIGMYPLLCPGYKEFAYQSCTPLPTSSGSVEGSFTFVPGRLAEPKGGPFKVTVARFPLQVPDYVF
ncbi:putative F-box domain, ApaG domain, Knr4/Smi1-like domain-containing protein [Lupinus albus]|uniref:Putative F-box domain, ApaG domain, Knr4/Smi1-like domain-containing protein n=1 Tax=Lupinus albus TaxID=3870 RepID=A0A6A4R130_LUPAL|nr:putative F-box domain, ApaG domain, Knr4/Smi1-like domain-containing protein [Lupinus albus]